MKASQVFDSNMSERMPADYTRGINTERKLVSAKLESNI